MSLSGEGYWWAADTVNTGNGNDTIYNYGKEYALMNTGAGNDFVSLGGNGDNVTLDSGDGNDTVNVHWTNRSSIKTGAGNDVIIFSGNPVSTVTVEAGAGNDTIYGDTTECTVKRRKNIYKYAAGDGNDVIYNITANDVISVTGGTYSTTISGNDVVVKVGSGSITLKDAKGISFGINDAAYWFDEVAANSSELSSIVNLSSANGYSGSIGTATNLNTLTDISSANGVDNGITLYNTNKS